MHLHSVAQRAGLAPDRSDRDSSHQPVLWRRRQLSSDRHLVNRDAAGWTALPPASSRPVRRSLVRERRAMGHVAARWQAAVPGAGRDFEYQVPVVPALARQRKGDCCASRWAIREIQRRRRYRGGIRWIRDLPPASCTGRHRAVGGLPVRWARMRPSHSWSKSSDLVEWDRNRSAGNPATPTDRWVYLGAAVVGSALSACCGTICRHAHRDHGAVARVVPQYGACAPKPSPPVLRCRT